ncbi:MAG: hypothetical protein JSS02_15620, partial [Planctomycetes bacterium]|nr:hypothetical protein [Planctomycetota bacterium]
MLLRNWRGVVLALAALVSTAQAAEPVLLKHKFAKGEQLIYKSTEDNKQTQ